MITTLDPEVSTTDMDMHRTQFTVSQYDDAERLTFSSVTKVKCQVHYHISERKARLQRADFSLGGWRYNMHKDANTSVISSTFTILH